MESDISDPAKTKYFYNIYKMLDQRRRRCIEVIVVACLLSVVTYNAGTISLTVRNHTFIVG